MSIGFMRRMSPEYVIEHAIEDIKASGVDGVRKYLTEAAEKRLDNFMAKPEVKEGSFLTTMLSGDSLVGFFINKMSECSWAVKDVMKGDESSKSVVGFDFKGNLQGTIEISLVKEDKEWKIDGFGSPHFNKVSLQFGGK